MHNDRQTLTRRTVLQTVLGTTIASAGYAGLSTADDHWDDTVSDGDSIQDAIDDASQGDTICVEAGTYDEDVTVDVEAVTLEGPNAGIPGAGDRDAEATVEGRVVLSADETTVDGFEITPPAAEANQESEAVRASNTPNDVVIANNVVREFERDDPNSRYFPNELRQCWLNGPKQSDSV